MPRGTNGRSICDNRCSSAILILTKHWQMSVESASYGLLTGRSSPRRSFQARRSASPCDKLEGDPMSSPEAYKAAILQTIEGIDTAGVDRAIQWFHDARASHRSIFVCGNGGSASTASHFACDIVKGASYQRNERFKILALTDSLPTLTAYSNDVGYDCVFAEQLKNFAQPDDVVMCISGSGNSP